MVRKHMSVCARRAESFERKRERERETAGGLMGVEGAERMGWGPILARKKDFGGRFCVAVQLAQTFPR